MGTNKWDDKEIEKVFDAMPAIQDTRSKEDVLARLKQDERLQAPKRKKGRWMPAFVAVAALLVLSVLLPSMLGDDNKSMDKASDSSITVQEEMRDEASAVSESIETNLGNSQDSAGLAFFAAASENYTSAVYVKDTADGTVFHLGLASDAASSIPVTFVIPNSQIKEDFGKLELTSLELYEQYAPKLDEGALGFHNYHPYKGKFTVEGDALIHKLPSNHGYDSAPASKSVYEATLQDTFYGFREIKFINEKGSTIEFDQVGELSKPLQLASGTNHYNYYLIQQDNGTEYLSSNFSRSYETLTEALQEMKVKPNDVYSPVIPETIYFDVIEGDGLTKVSFKQPLDLTSMDSQKALQMVEGMLLTGASFDEQLQFENVVQVEWNGFDFSKPLQVPIGPNQMPFILKE